MVRGFRPEKRALVRVAKVSSLTMDTCQLTNQRKAVNDLKHLRRAMSALPPIENTGQLPTNNPNSASQKSELESKIAEQTYHMYSAAEASSSSLSAHSIQHIRTPQNLNVFIETSVMEIVAAFTEKMKPLAESIDLEEERNKHPRGSADFDDLNAQRKAKNAVVSLLRRSMATLETKLINDLVVLCM